jgi:hypothetical protein
MSITLIDFITRVVTGGKLNSPADSTAVSTFDLINRRYAEGQRTGVHVDRQTTAPGLPTVQGGSRPLSIDPFAWRGADSIHTLTTIATDTIAPKIGTGDITIRGAAVIANSSVEIFTDDAMGFGGSTNNYIFNKGEVRTDGGQTPINPQVGDALHIDAVGKDGVVVGSEASCPLDNKWSRLISIVPEDLATGGFFYSKGYTDYTNCQFGIYSDGTSVYRVIGGSRKAIDTVANILSLTGEITFKVDYSGDGTPWDSVYVNGVNVWKETEDLIGAVTSTLPEMVGGIYATDSAAAASILNHDGRYRRLCRYGREHMLNRLILAQYAKAMYSNYTSSIFVWGLGDSIMNGFGGASSDRSKCFFFLMEQYFIDQGYDVLFANNGVSGSAYNQGMPSDVALPNYFSYDSVNEDDERFNTSDANITNVMENFRPDIVIGNSGTNEYGNQFENEAPYDWSIQGHALQLISAKCTTYGVPFIPNSTGVHRLPNTDFERDIGAYISEHLTQRCGNMVDWQKQLIDPSTGLAPVDFTYDDVHLSLLGNEVVETLYRPHITGFVHSTQVIYPETI